MQQYLGQAYVSDCLWACWSYFRSMVILNHEFTSLIDYRNLQSAVCSFICKQLRGNSNALQVWKPYHLVLFLSNSASPLAAND